MPITDPERQVNRHQLIRDIHVVHGTLTFAMRCHPAFNYGRDPHTLRNDEQGVVFQSATMKLALTGSVPEESRQDCAIKSVRHRLLLESGLRRKKRSCFGMPVHYLMTRCAIRGIRTIRLSPQR